VKDRMQLLFGSCPRPMSRKKLRQLMPHNRNALTSAALWSRYDRKPGPGKTRSSMHRNLDALEQQKEKVGTNRMEKAATMLLTRLRGLFADREKRQTKVQRQAQRGR